MILLPNVPKLPDLRNRIAGDLELRYEQAGMSVDAKTPGSGYAEIANVMTGLVHGLWGAAQYIARQQIIETMDEATLIKVAGEYGITRIPASYAEGNVSVTSTQSVNISPGVILQSSSGQQYQVTSVQNFVGAQTLAVPVRAIVPGELANLSDGETVSLVSPIANIEGDISVSVGGITGGSNIEDLDRFRARLAERKKAPPIGGKRSDYVAWAKEAHADVTRGWVFEHENGIGSVVLRIVTENLNDPIPTATVINAVDAYIADLRPAGLRSFSVVAPVAKPLDLTFTLLQPNTQEVQDAVAAELEDLLHRVGAPDTVLPLSHIREAISRATGEQDFAITLNGDVSFATNEYPVLGTTTFP